MNTKISNIWDLIKAFILTLILCGFAINANFAYAESEQNDSQIENATNAPYGAIRSFQQKTGISWNDADPKVKEDYLKRWLRAEKSFKRKRKSHEKKMERARKLKKRGFQREKSKYERRIKQREREEKRRKKAKEQEKRKLKKLMREQKRKLKRLRNRGKH